MKKKKLVVVARALLICLIVLAGSNLLRAQTWSPNFAVGTITGNYNFSYAQTPDKLVEIYTALLPNDAGATFQWQQSASPVFSSYTNATGTSTLATYTFSAALSQTTYFRLAVTSGGATVYSNIVKIAVVSTNWEDVNYIREHAVLTTGITASWTTVDGLAIGQKMMTTDYLDGIGRPVEGIRAGVATPATGSNTWGDVVRFYKYDAYGREPLKYQGYTTTGSPGKYKASPVTDQASYYSSVYGETAGYTSTTYDNSPLNRVINIKEPGTSWASAPGDSAAYDMNTSAENVQIFSTDYIQGDAPVDKGAYPASSLFKRTVTDEGGKKVIEYIDKSGKIILTKTQLSASPSVAHSGWICVYSVYDDFGFLRFQLQPGAVSYLDANSWSFAGTNGQQVLNEMCYQYNYDDKGQVIWKKAPGAGALKMLYDSRERLVFTQDSNQAALSTPQWTANLYDILDRVTTRLLYNTTESTASLQSDINTALATNTNPISSANLSNPAVTTILKYYYYDDYSYSGAKAFSTNFDNNTAYNPASDANVIPIVSSKRTLSKLTGESRRIMGTSTFLLSSDYYDEKGRPIQSVQDNMLQGQDITTNQYHWDGRLLSVSRKHTTTGSGFTTFPILSVNVFDKIGRLSGIQKKFGSNATVRIADYTYDDIGRVKVVTLDSTYTGSGKTNMESLAYTYNIHNQVTGINKDYAVKGSTYSKWKNFFGLYIGYDNRDAVFAASQLDGHVTGQMWCTQGDDAQRKYDYTYDAAGRLINAAYNEQQQAGSGWAHSAVDFSITGTSGQITYDLNGNLLNMIHKGVLPGTSTPVQVDNLTYTYQSNSNKISYVTDNGTAGSSNGLLGDFKDGTNAANSPDYVYDANGNLIVDLNKAIGAIGTPGITYNCFDKPTQILLAGKGTINIVYDGDGQKVQKSFVPTSGTTVTTTYIREFSFQTLSTSASTNNLSFINFEEGRIRTIHAVAQNNGYDVLTISGTLSLPDTLQGVFDFFIKDNQANTRMILTDEVHTGSNQCTMETSRASAEDPIFQGSGNEVENTRVAITTIPGQSTGGGWHSNTSASVSQLGDYTGAFKMGPNVLLKVMAGDTINATTQYYYQAAGSYSAGTAGLTQGVLTSIINAIGGGSAASSVVKAGSSNIQTTLNGSNPFAVITDPGTAGTANTAAPQAYLTVLFFDERFNYLSSGSQWIQVSQAGDGASPLVLANLQAPKNGYAFAYLSNKSTQAVFFDNMQVGVKHGRIIEEDHYYSYGLKIATISSNIVVNPQEGVVANKYLLGGEELQDEGGLNWYDYGYRNYDPQIGRFAQVDALTDATPALSPYLYAYDEPIRYEDHSGLMGGVPICPWTSSIVVFFEKATYYVGKGLDAIQPVETVFSVTAHLASDASLVLQAISVNEVVNRTTTAAVGEKTAAEGDDGPQGPGPSSGPTPPIFWAEFKHPFVYVADADYAKKYAPERGQIKRDPDYPNIKFLVFHRLGKLNPNNPNTPEKNRREAKKANRYRLKDMLKEADEHLHEVAYASTEEGGAQAIMYIVDADDNVAHGIDLGKFFLDKHVVTGEEFWVPILDDDPRNRIRVPVPFPIPEKDPFKRKVPKPVPIKHRNPIFTPLLIKPGVPQEEPLWIEILEALEKVEI